MKKTLLIILALFMLTACTTVEDTEVQQAPAVDGYYYDDEGNPWLIDPDKVLAGGPSKDGIPSIDNPVYTDVWSADEWIADNELVLALTYEGVTRAYPLQILVFHEIVNDHIAGDAILITYCPLCGSGIAYKPILNGQEVEFGTSGKLYNSNLIMYDRDKESYWTQIDGIAINGDYIGTELEAIDIDTVVWGDWKLEHTDAEVLSQKTGYSRSYGTDPYGNYYFEDSLFFGVENEDDSIHSKTPVYGIEINGVYKAYIEDDVIAEGGTVEDTVNGVNLIIVREDTGDVSITNTDTGEEIVKERDFWFAWYAFHPDTLVYGR